MVEGQTLDKIVAGPGKLPPSLVAQYALKAAEGLEVIHNKGLFHGLLKPSNIMIGNAGEVYILDLGIGSLLAESEGESLVDTMSTANSVVSGLDCASPESIMDPTNLTPAGDQYSLGCVMYYCMTGRFPFPDGTAAEKMISQQSREPESLEKLVPDMPSGLAAVVLKLMDKTPTNRYASAGAVIEALRPFAGSSAAQRASAPAPRPAAESKKPAAKTPAPDAFSAPSASPGRPTSPAREMPAREIPTRNSVRGSAPASPASRPPSVKSRGPAPASAPVASSRPTPVPPTRASFSEPEESGSKFGPVSLAVSAVLLSVLAWLVSWKMF